MIDTSMWRFQLLFVAIAVLALALRVGVVFGSPLTVDESFTWRVIDYGWSDMVGRVAEDGHAPLHFICLKVYSILAGRSLVSLRMFSVLCYLLATAAHYGAFRAALSLRGGAATGNLTDYKAEMLLLLAMLTFDPLQVFVAANARMYSLGMLFVALGTWTLLKALATNGRNATVLWILWGILSGAGMLTHHFVGFVTAGQVLAGLWIMLREKSQARRAFLTQVGSLTIGCLTAVVVYSPWLSVIRDQFAEVNRQFWIGPLTFSGVAGTFTSWLTGMAAEDWTISYALLSTVLAIFFIVVGLWKSPLATVPFACQALIPWVLCVGISLASGRPLLQDRYLVFGQASALTAICFGCGTLKPVGWRIATGGVLVAGHLVGAISDPIPYHLTKDSFAQCVATVLANDDGNTSKTILVRWPADVNRTRYFLDQAKRNDFQVKLLASPFRIGHVGHIAALESREIYWSPLQQPPEVARGAWIIYDEPGNSALGILGGVEIVAEYEIRTTDIIGGKAIHVRSSRESAVPVP